MCTVLLPPGYNPIAANKYIIHRKRIVIGHYTLQYATGNVSALKVFAILDKIVK